MRIESFRAVRPKRSYVKDVASYPYDVVDREEARRLARDNPLSFLHIVRSDIDLPDEVDLHDDRVYDKARETFHRFLAEGVLRRDPLPSLYLYRQSMGNHVQDGIVACVHVEDYDNGLIKRHELTRADKEIDRTRHIDTVNAQTGPIFMTYRASLTIDSIVSAVAAASPEFDFTADDGIGHTLWIIDEPSRIASIREAFSEIDSLYIADGHHRAASAAAVARARREDFKNHRDDCSNHLMMAVLFPHNQLRIMDYNRAVADLNGYDPAGFLVELDKNFILTSGTAKGGPGRPHEFSLYLAGLWHRLNAREGSYNGRDIVDSLDVEILQRNILAPLLKICDPRTDERIAFIGGIRGIDKLERLVDSGRFAAAFALYPPTIEQLLAVADGGRTMPPKSTWFEPKLRSGLVIHLLND
ncbi:MAG: DUF1015 domain-containing protein [Deltaproteobacteria bacterium]|nr:DUF1015 domain-containing protein [Deltaproteobacteria bacterium]